MLGLLKGLTSKVLALYHFDMWSGTSPEVDMREWIVSTYNAVKGTVIQT